MNDSKKKVLEIKQLASLQQIAEIKKLAQEGPPPNFAPKGKPKGTATAPPGDAGANPPPTGGGRFGPPPGTKAPAARPTGGGGVAMSPAIRDMQKAIQGFATAAVKYRLGKPEPDQK